MFKSLRAVWLLLAIGIFVGPATAQEIKSAGTQRIITFDAKVPPAERAARIVAQGGVIVHELPLINAVAAYFPATSIRVLDVKLQAMSGIVNIEIDRRQKWIESAPALPSLDLPSLSDVLRDVKTSRPAARKGNESASNIPWGVARVDAPAAWSRTKGDGIKVGVIDTGIDYNHSQLRSNVKGGYNVLVGSNANDFMDDNGHGTHVSGTIAAADNGQGVAGVAPHANLYGIKVLDANGEGSFSDVIAGIGWAAAHGMDVVNMSLGGSQGSDALQAAVDQATKMGVTIIAAAGNSGPGPNTVGYPGAYPQVIAVAAIDKIDQVAYFSSRGPQVAFAAPGVDIYSTYYDGGYTTMSGTSMACPHMVGLAALVMSSKHVRGVDAVRAAFQAAVSPLRGAAPEEQGAGVVDALKLVR